MVRLSEGDNQELASLVHKKQKLSQNSTDLKFKNNRKEKKRYKMMRKRESTIWCLLLILLTFAVYPIESKEQHNGLRKIIGKIDVNSSENVDDSSFKLDKAATANTTAERETASTVERETSHKKAVHKPKRRYRPIQSFVPTCSGSKIDLCSRFDSSSCVDLPNGKGYTCKCDEFFIGNPLQGQPCDMECSNPWGSPCGPDICIPTKTGHKCEIIIDVDDCPVGCPNSMHCEKVNSRHKCVCNPGYYSIHPFLPCIKSKT